MLKDTSARVGYSARMIASLHRLSFGLICLLLATPAFAVKVTKLEIKGLSDSVIEENVRTSLSLHGEMDKDLRARRLNYLLQIAETEARTALEPFGYYSPDIQIERSDRQESSDSTENSRVEETTSGDTEPEPASPNIARSHNGKDGLTITLNINPGTAVQVRQLQLSVIGDAQNEPAITAALSEFQPQLGQVFDHRQYEASKEKISRLLERRGYFDAEATRHTVTVTRAEASADIDLQWTSGQRHRFGDTHFSQQPKRIIRDELLYKLLPWQQGDLFDEAELDRLRRSLVGLDYFNLIDVQAHPDATDDLHIPIEIELIPAKRSIYSAGASYGTLSGTGINLGVERRYLNQRGHKSQAQLDWGNKRKIASLQYRIPAFSWLDGWYTTTLLAADEQTAYVNSRRLEIVGSRNGQYNAHLNLIASLHLLRERWAYYTPLRPMQSFQFASFVFPSLQAEYIDVDDRMAPRRGSGANLMLRGGKGGSDGRATFSQLYVSAQWFHGFTSDSRLLVRGELGHTFTRDVLNLPPSLRFYAGGDRSVRGYGWHEIGPSLITSGGTYFTGAPNLLTSSAEYERYFTPNWGAAAFIDSGSAFDGKHAKMHTGIGLGVRWRSPVGPLRIDIARGLKSPDSPFTLHLNIGADL